MTDIPTGMEPAFPFQCKGPTTGPEIYYGITVRDWFAGMALQGMLSNPDHAVNQADTAGYAFGYADAMIKEREESCP